VSAAIARAPGATALPAPSAGVRRLADLVAGAASVVALTGAGISVPSGIPDFRSPGSGIWESVDPMGVAHIDVFRREPERFWAFYGERFSALEDRQPNGAHHALVELERRGMLHGVITQNIDMLHRRAGTRELVEVHGSIAEALCLRCARRYPAAEVRTRVRVEPDGVPRCACRTPLKPDVVLFGELLPEQAMARAHGLCERADVLLCIGSSLEVYPVAGLPMVTRRAGGSLAVITRGPTPLDAQAVVRLDGDVVAELEALLGVLSPVAGP